MLFNYFLVDAATVYLIQAKPLVLAIVNEQFIFYWLILFSKWILFLS